MFFNVFSIHDKSNKLEIEVNGGGEMEVNLLNVIKGIYKCFPSKARIPILTTPVKNSTGSTSHWNKARKRENILAKKEEEKLPVFANDMIENLRNL